MYRSLLVLAYLQKSTQRFIAWTIENYFLRVHSPPSKDDKKFSLIADHL